MECQESLLQYIYMYISQTKINLNDGNQSLVDQFWVGDRLMVGSVQSLLNPVVGSDLWVQIDKIDQLNWTFLDFILLE